MLTLETLALTVLMFPFLSNTDALMHRIMMVESGGKEMGEGFFALFVILTKAICKPLKKQYLRKAVSHNIQLC